VPMDSLRSIVVVGASIAGVRSAQALRRRGYDGALRVIGEEPVPVYRRPALSKRYLTGEQAWPGIALGESGLDADMLLGARATRLELGARCVWFREPGSARESRLCFDGLVISTGAQPRRLSLPDLDGVHPLRTLADADQIRRKLTEGARVVVVGGGFVGCEVAATCRGLGLDVTVVETDSALMGRALGSQVGAFLTDLHTRHGARVLLGATVAGFRGTDHVEAVALADGTILPADLVVIGIGVKPATGWLEDSGIPLADGVLCSPNLAVAGTDRVTAAGDVVRWPHAAAGGLIRVEHWDNAVRQGDTAARTLLEGPGAPAFDAATMFWSDQYDVKIQLLGHATAADSLQVLEGDLTRGPCVAAYGRQGRVSAVLLIGCPQRLSAYQALVRHPTSFPVRPARSETTPGRDIHELDHIALS
jgi:3-phenylpropionate/trans-cinnamate dioxygenase ferredoxin reductase component